MRKFGVCLALTGATVWLTGCGYLGGSSASSSRGGIAVVDLDKIAQETGKAIEMKEALDATEINLKQQLITFQANANADLKSKLDDLADKGEAATDADKIKVEKFRIDATNQLAKGQNEAGAMLGQFKQNQIQVPCGSQASSAGSGCEARIERGHSQERRTAAVGRSRRGYHRRRDQGLSLPSGCRCGTRQGNRRQASHSGKADGRQAS